MKLKVLEIQSDKKGDATLQDVESELKNDKSTYIINNINREMYITYKKYQFKIDSNLNVRLVDEVTDNNVNSDTKARYLLIEVNGYLSSTCAVINEL